MTPVPGPPSPFPIPPPQGIARGIRRTSPDGARRPSPKENIMTVTTDRMRRSLRRFLREEDGASTAEYAITVLAACGFAAVLVDLLASGEVRSLLMGIITTALSRGA